MTSGRRRRLNSAGGKRRSAGTVKFTTSYPGWYSGRVTHIHVMVHNPSNLTTPVKTTQFVFPDNINTSVY
jgi:protocatechuate 3,4-dioxygenase beta subunit